MSTAQRLVSEYWNTYLELQETLSKFWLEYSDISDFVRSATQTLTKENLWEKVSNLSDEDLLEIESKAKKLREVVLNVKWSLDKLWIPDNEFNNEVEKYLTNRLLILPESWKWDKDLELRFEDLIKVSESNPDWWNKWKWKINFHSKWISLYNFSNWPITFSDSQSELSRWDKIENIDTLPSYSELHKLRDFILSAWEENKQALMRFFWINSWFYLSSTSWNILWWISRNRSKLKKAFNIETWKHIQISISQDWILNSLETVNVRLLEI